MIAEALHMLRIRQRLTQAAVSKREGAPDCRTLSHWENRRKQPGAVLLRSYLASPPDPKTDGGSLRKRTADVVSGRLD